MNQDHQGLPRRFQLQGTVQGGRKRGRQKKRWEKNIAEWTGLRFCDAVREAENKIKWKGEGCNVGGAPMVIMLI